MIRHLIIPPRKTEPKLILYLRKSVIIVSLLSLFGIAMILFVRMINEQPTISSTLTPTNILPAPAVHLGFLYNFNITCWLYYNYNGTMADNCDKHIIETKRIGLDDYPYVGKFEPKDINLTGYNDHKQPIFVFLHININDPSFPTTFNDSAQQSSFRMVAYDSENEYDTMNKDFDDTLISPFEKSLFYINKHTLSGGYIYKFGYSRKVRKTLIQSPLALFGYFGFPAYDTKPYIESSIQDVPMSKSNFDFINVRIGPQCFVLEDEYEQRNNTIIDILGSIAAFYSSIVFIYVFLFGVESMKPWGVVHGCCGGRYGFGRLKMEKQEKLAKIIDGDLEVGGDDFRAIEVVEVHHNLSQKINYLEEFNNFLKSDVIDIDDFKKYQQRRRRRQQQNDDQQQNKNDNDDQQDDHQQDHLQEDQRDQDEIAVNPEPPQLNINL